MFNSMTLLTALFLFVLAPAPAMPAGQNGAPAQAGANPAKPTPESQAKAKKVYEMDCAVCHGENGNGKTDLATAMQVKLPDFTDPTSLAGKTDQGLFTSIRNGKDKMPPEAVGRANDNEVWNLIIYIRRMSQPAGATASGK